jgi:succinyl-diaminopimelate desuccinylase
VTAPAVAPLDLRAEPAALLARLVDAFSVSGSEGPLADAIEKALRGLPHLRIHRHGDAVVARTQQGRAERVLIAGHIDTVPSAGNLPARIDDGVLWGLGSSDMKAGVAVMLRLAAGLAAPTRDVTYVFYDHEEVEEARNGLGRLARDHADWLAGDFAVLMEPSNALVEAGCQGTLRADITVRGRRAHSARSWMGVNAIHRAAAVLDRLAGYEPRRPIVDGLEYREGLNAVAITGGVAGNVIPDSCTVSVNYRFAPDRSLDAAAEHVRAVFAGHDVVIIDGAAGALPGLGRPAAAEFVAAIGSTPNPKLGWTDVARFSAFGVPAVNYGPGDPLLAHSPDERVQLTKLAECEESLLRWLTG